MSKKTFTVVVHVLNNSSSFIGEPCYLASDVGNWQADGCFVGAIPERGERITHVWQGVKKGELAFKITRGSWSTLNSSVTGDLLAPYYLDVKHDLEMEVSIDAWRDEFPSSTASPQVHVLADNFYFPQLNSYRKIWVYLPKDYRLSDKHYPVIYMHDGQHLFDEATSVGRAGPVEWKVDETIDASNQPAIVIGIAHPPQVADREREFLLYPFRDITNPAGSLYLDDIVAVLKPFVDKHYRTLADKQHTAMAGSSLGGLLTLYAGALYPEVFGTLGVLSPSIWTGRRELWDFFAAKLQKDPHLLCGQYYFFYVGGKEKRKNTPKDEPDMRSDVLEFIDTHKKAMCVKMTIDIDEEGRHGALYWQKAFTRFYTWWRKHL